MKSFSLVIALSGLLLYFYGCNEKMPDYPKAPSAFAGATHPPTVRTFPSSGKEISQWISAMDDQKIRAHGWDIWESINTTAANGQPIWENWFSGYEIFQDTTPLQARLTVKDFAFPSQFFHASVFKSSIPNAPAERGTSFNRYSPSLAQYIYNNNFYLQKTLDSINRAFDNNKTPPAGRQISTSKDTTDPYSFALKPVFQFISGTEPTAIPYWAGISPFTTVNMTNPSPGTWRQCVVVDPTGKLKKGDSALMSCNGEPARKWPVVSLSDFYQIKITRAMADSFSTFAATSGDDVGQNNQSDSLSVAEMVKEGNIALLMAMHVTGKEISNWTWQTFWWSPNPQDAIYGADRPASIPAPWNNYNMNTAYYMVSPPGQLQDGEPLITFNPYLETNLFGTLRKDVGLQGKDSVNWYGVFTNCMSCHRMAAWKVSNYIPNGEINPADPILFSINTKTDFLWSIPVRAR